MKQGTTEILFSFLLFLISSCISRLQIRVKHMLSVGAVEQSNMTSGYSRFNATNSGRLLETNTENLLRMVLYLFKHFEILHYTHTHITR